LILGANDHKNNNNADVKKTTEKGVIAVCRHDCEGFIFKILFFNERLSSSRDT
jgi:hypothetical protein